MIRIPPPLKNDISGPFNSCSDNEVLSFIEKKGKEKENDDKFSDDSSLLWNLILTLFQALEKHQ